MKILRKWRDKQGVKWVRYSARFWEGPEALGEQGRYVERTLETPFFNGRPANVSPNVSYYKKLVAA